MIDKAEVMVDELGEKIESLAVYYKDNEDLSDWKKKDMLKSDLHHVTMEFKTRLIELVRELQNSMDEDAIDELMMDIIEIVNPIGDVYTDLLTRFNEFKNEQ